MTTDPPGDNFEPEPPTHRTRAELKAFLDGELSAARKLKVRLHLVRCEACREERSWLHQLGSDMKELEKAKPRPELRAKILASLPDTPPAAVSAPSRWHGASTLRYAPALASVGLVSLLLTGGVFAYYRLSEPSEAQQRAVRSVTLPPQVRSRPAPASPPSAGAGIPLAGPLSASSSRDLVSEEADRLMAEEGKREAQLHLKARREERRRAAQRAAQGKPSVETPLLKLASAEGGVNGDAFVAQFRETVHKAEGKFLSAKPLHEETGAVREITLKVPAERVEEFLGDLNREGKLTKLSAAPASASSSVPGLKAHAIALTDDNRNPASGGMDAPGRPKVLVVQPDRKGYVAFRIRLAP